jgi:hypothetical protein
VLVGAGIGVTVGSGVWLALQPETSIVSNNMQTTIVFVLLFIVLLRLLRALPTPTEVRVYL